MPKNLVLPILIIIALSGCFWSNDESTPSKSDSNQVSDPLKNNLSSQTDEHNQTSEQIEGGAVAPSQSQAFNPNGNLPEDNAEQQPFSSPEVPVSNDNAGNDMATPPNFSNRADQTDKQTRSDDQTYDDKSRKNPAQANPVSPHVSDFANSFGNNV